MLLKKSSLVKFFCIHWPLHPYTFIHSKQSYNPLALMKVFCFILLCSIRPTDIFICFPWYHDEAFQFLYLNKLKTLFYRPSTNTHKHLWIKIMLLLCERFAICNLQLTKQPCAHSLESHFLLIYSAAHRKIKLYARRWSRKHKAVRRHNKHGRKN